MFLRSKCLTMMLESHPHSRQEVQCKYPTFLKCCLVSTRYGSWRCIKVPLLTPLYQTHSLTWACNVANWTPERAKLEGWSTMKYGFNCFRFIATQDYWGSIMVSDVFTWHTLCSVFHPKRLLSSNHYVSQLRGHLHPILNSGYNF